MDILPPEVMADVIYWACTDGGRTSCSLRETSRTLRSLVEPCRFRIVAIQGTLKLRNFINTFTALLPKYQHIEHLYVTDNPPPTRAQRLVRSALSHIGISQEAQQRHLFLPDIFFVSKLDVLIHACAPHLQSLSVFLSKENTRNWAIPRTTELLYPVLSHLSMAYLQPNLRTLHFPILDRSHLPVLETWHIAAPNLLSARPRLPNSLKETAVSLNKGSHINTEEHKSLRLVLEVIPNEYMLRFLADFVDPGSTSTDGRTRPVLNLRALLPTGSSRKKMIAWSVLERADVIVKQAHDPEEVDMVRRSCHTTCQTPANHDRSPGATGTWTGVFTQRGRMESSMAPVYEDVGLKPSIRDIGRRPMTR
jgi:hypothetical protein